MTRFATHRTLARVTAGCAVALVAANATAYSNFVDFESGGYTLAADGGASTTLSTEQSLSPTNSAKFELPNTQTDFSKVIIDVAAGDLDLGTASGTFYSYIPDTGSNPAYLPYMYFGVDSNNNGVWDFNGGSTGDSFVIAFITGAPAPAFDTWVQSGIDSSTNVHVVGGRQGLASGTYSSSGSQDTLASLSAMTTGSGLWGDLDVREVRVGAGETGGNVGPYVAYVDNIAVAPEPASLGLLGLGGLMMLKRRRK